MSPTMCVLLWPHAGAADALVAYEDKVLALVPEHGGTVLQRVRGNGADGQPLEIQILRFPTEQALSDYLADERRQSLASERDRAIARTDVIDVELA